MAWTVKPVADMLILHVGSAPIGTLTPTEARTLAAELVRAAGEGEPHTEPGEFRCPNCRKRRDFTPVLDDHGGDTGTLGCDECDWIIDAPKEKAEPVVERSCHTCRWMARDLICDQPDPGRDAITRQYRRDAQFFKGEGGLPLDRTIACPGHASKVTT